MSVAVGAKNGAACCWRTDRLRSAETKRRSPTGLRPWAAGCAIVPTL